MESNAEKNTEQGCFRWRYFTAVLGFFLFFSSYAMRSNISVAIVDMVISNDSDSVSSLLSDPYYNSGRLTKSGDQGGEFNWDSSTQGLVLSSFYWGYIIPQILAGRLADKFGPKYVVLVGGLLGNVMTLLAPVAARCNVGFLIATRFFCGLGLGVYFPCLNSIIAKWALRSERSFFTSFIASGSHAGTIISMPLSGVLCSSSADWPWAFYLFGIIGLLVLLLWAIFVYNLPQQNPWISTQERLEIEKSLNEVINFEKNPPVPWKTLLKSKAVWAMIIVSFANGWGCYTMLTELPTYMNDVLGFDISENGLYSALPYLLALIMGNLSGMLADFIIRRKLLKVVTTRKLFSAVAMICSGGFLLIIPFVNGPTMLIYTFLLLSIGLDYIYYGGFLVNASDLVPNFAGTIIGITNSIGSVPGIISPYITGVITDSKSGSGNVQDSWAIVFYISAGILFAGIIIYVIFAEGEVLPWNELHMDTTMLTVKSGSTSDIESVKIDNLPDINTHKNNGNSTSLNQFDYK